MSKTIRNVVCFFFLSIFLYSCALTETQIKAVNKFAETSKNFSQYPSKIFTVLADVREKRAIYDANINHDKPSQLVNELNMAYDEKKRNYKFSQKMDLTFKIIDKYAQSLLLLTSDKYTEDLEKQSATFGKGLDALIGQYNQLETGDKLPVGVGDLVGKLVMFGGKLYIRTQQGIQVKKYVPMADTLIEKLTTKMTDILTKKMYIAGDSINIETLINNEEDGLKVSYQAYILACHEAGELPELESEREYLALRADLDNLRELLKQTQKAVKGLREAHSKLLKAINEKKKLGDYITEFQSYYEDIKSIHETIEKIEG